MKRRQFLNVSIKISVAGALALSGAAVAHRLLWDYESAPKLLPPMRQPTRPGTGTAGSPSVPAPSPGALSSARSEAAAASASLRCLSARELVIVRAVALRILAGAEPSAEPDGAAAQCQFIDEYLGGLDGALRSDVKALFSLVELYPTVTGRFTRFSRLPAAAQDEVLRSWETSRLALLRQGLQALKAMCFLAHYQDARSFPSLGYTGPLVPEQGLGRILPAR